MKAASISELKNELKTLSQKDLVDVCLRLAKYKTDNKALIGFLLFEAHNKPAFVEEIKNEIITQFNEINPQQNLYFIKKSLRKIKRQIVKYAKYIDDKALAADLHIFFCLQLKESGIPFEKSQQLSNLYAAELKTILGLIKALHPDLQADYNHELEKII